MGDLILIKIMQHLDYLDCLEISTRKILKLSLSEGIDGLECLTENRERLINIIKSHQMTISSDIKEIMRNRDVVDNELKDIFKACLLYTSPSPRDVEESRMPSSA